MKFAIFLQHYFPYGGLQRDAVRLAQAAVDEGDSPHLVVSTWNGPKPEGFDITELNSGGQSNHRKSANFAHDCQELLKSGDFDKSICFSRVPGSDFQFCGDPCFADRFKRTKPNILRWLPRYKYLLEQEAAIFGETSLTHLFFLAESEIPAYKNHYNISSSKVTVLPPWLKKPAVFDSASTVIKQEVLESLKLPPESELLLFVGSDFQRKGLDRAIKALAHIQKKNFHLLVCGQSKPDTFEAISRKLEISEQVHFLGPRDDIPRLMTASTLLIHPARQETAGMVLLEALTYGLPVLCTENCGYSTHVHEAGCNLLTSNPSTEEISKALLSSLPQLQNLQHKTLTWSNVSERYKTAKLLLQTMRNSI